MRLIPSPQHRILVVLGYPDVFAAADAVPGILTADGLIGLEGIDDVLVGHMLESHLNTEHLGLLPNGRGWLFAELGADDAATAAAHADALVASLPTRGPTPAIDHRRYDDPETAGRVWLIRESGLGATAIRGDGTHNAEGWEDAAVHPARLGEYLRAMTALLAGLRLQRRVVRPLRAGLRPHAQQLRLRDRAGAARLPRVPRASDGPRGVARRLDLGRARRRAGTGRAARRGSTAPRSSTCSVRSRRCSTRAGGSTPARSSTRIRSTPTCASGRRTGATPRAPAAPASPSRRTPARCSRRPSDASASAGAGAARTRAA